MKHLNKSWVPNVSRLLSFFFTFESHNKVFANKSFSYLVCCVDEIEMWPAFSTLLCILVAFLATWDDYHPLSIEKRNSLGFISAADCFISTVTNNDVIVTQPGYRCYKKKYALVWIDSNINLILAISTNWLRIFASRVCDIN